MGCKTCNTGGQVFRQCPKCSEFWCSQCLRSGAGGLPKSNSGSKCPYCQKLGQMKTVSENVVAKTHKHILK